MKFKVLHSSFLIVFFIANAVAAQVNGSSLEIIQDEVRSGEPIEIELTLPDGGVSPRQIRVFRTPDFWISKLFSARTVSREDATTVNGQSMRVAFDTLNYSPGTYYFAIYVGESIPNYIYDSVNILPRDDAVPGSIADDMRQMGSVLGLYRKSGESILPSESVFPGETLALAVNLNLVGSFDNSVSVDLSGPTFYLPDLMQLKISRDFDESKTNLAGQTDPCYGTVDAGDFSPNDGIAVVYFRAPQHKKFHEYDGELDFVLNARLPATQGCQRSIETLSVYFEDDPASAPIPDFETFNETNFPGQTIRNNFPFDSFDVRIVRVSTATESLLPGNQSTILAGETFGEYAVDGIEMKGAPVGVYTFHVLNPTDGKVYLLKDGSRVYSLDYDWLTTISGTDSSRFYTFDFPGYFSITIRKAGPGTMNLYGVDNSIFNGIEHLSVSNNASPLDVDTTEMDELILLLEEEFAKATKGYFQLNVSGVEFIDYMTDDMIADAISWYDSVPKTPGLPVLDSSVPNQLLLMVGQYINNQMGENEFANWYRNIYPENSNGEDMTLYVVDFMSSLGKAMGAGAARIAKQRIYNLKCYAPGAIADRLLDQTDSTGTTTYHYAMSNCSNYTDTIEKYLDLLRREASIVHVVGTMIHEMGHALWLKPAGFSTGDYSGKRYPSKNDTVYIDRAPELFTRFEYMSYGRDRESLENMTYGDEMLEQLLYHYQAPELTVESLSHMEEKNNLVTIELGESVDYLLSCDAPSGAQFIEYRQLSGPSSTASSAQREPSNPLRISLEPEEVGTHVYSARCADNLFPTWGHQHQSNQVNFTIEVLEKPSQGTLFAGGIYGDYAIESIEMDGARTGSYTFHVNSPTSGEVILKKDGVPVYSLDYNWKKKIEDKNPRKFYTFDFSGYFSITVRKASTGKTNLFALDQSIFNGVEILTIKQFRNEQPSES